MAIKCADEGIIWQAMFNYDYLSVFPFGISEPNSTIGAGAAVRESIPDNSLAVGVPAKVVKSRSSEHEQQ